MMGFMLVVTWMMVMVCMAQADNNNWDEAKLLTEFTTWMRKFGKDKLYGANPALKMKKFNTFKNNVQYMLNHNNASSSLFSLGLNSFADVTFAEAQKIFLNGRGGGVNQTYAQQPDSATLCKGVKRRRSFDWRTRGVVNPIKDQGQCGKRYFPMCACECASRGSWRINRL